MRQKEAKALLEEIEWISDSYITEDKEEFIRQLRSNGYDIMIILGEHKKLKEEDGYIYFLYQ